MWNPMRHTQAIMSNPTNDTIIIGPPLPNGDDLDFTPRPADGLDDARVTILPDSPDLPDKKKSAHEQE
jgi:hypothetical protein